MDVKDAQDQIQTLLHPSAYWITGSHGPKSNHLRIQLALFVQISLSIGCRPGSALHTPGTPVSSKAEGLCWRDVVLYRTAKDDLGWTFSGHLVFRTLKARSPDDSAKYVHVIFTSSPTSSHLIPLDKCTSCGRLMTWTYLVSIWYL